MKKKRKFRTWIVVVFLLICLFGVIYNSYKIISWKLNVNENKKIKNSIDKSIKIINNKKDKGIRYEIDFDTLVLRNPDTVAYLKVNNTNIDYVVVKGKNNEYYLTHNYEKKWNVAGWVFGDYRNKFDGNDKNLIIYGHNTKDGSMFETLINVLDKKWYTNNENHIITLVTKKDTYNYQVFSTYSIIAEDYYITTSFNNNTFNKFINTLKKRSIFDYNIDVDNDDKILTLSSCIGDGTKRVVLHAKLID